MNALLRKLMTSAAGLALAGTVHAAPFAFITNCGSNDVSVIDIASDRVVATVPVGACPYGVAVSSGGAYAYVTNRDSNSVSVIDGRAMRETARIAVGSRPWGIAVEPSGRRVYVATPDSDLVLVIDPMSQSIIGTVSVAPDSIRPTGVIVHPDGSRLYVGASPPYPSFANNVVVVDTRTLRAIATIGASDAGISMALDAAGRRLYTSGFYGGAIIDTTTNQQIGKLLPPSDSLSHAVALNPSGTLAYASVFFPGGAPPGRFDGVRVVDLSSGALIARIAVAAPLGLSVEPSGGRVYVASSSTNSVSVIDTATRMVVANIGVGTAPVAFGQFIASGASAADIPTMSAMSLAALAFAAGMIGLLLLRSRS